LIRAALGVLLGWIAAVWLATLRVRVLVDPCLEAASGRPWVLSFFHGTQFPLLAWKRRKATVVMVSHSRDGAMQARALGHLGFTIVRGSSSRGGVRGLASLIRSMKRGADAAFAVDGPRGPYGQVKEGALAAARATGGMLVPMGSACARAWIATRAWDLFALPWPFTQVRVVLGAPLDPELATAGELAQAIAAANDAASKALTAGQRPAHGDGIGELEISSVGHPAGDA